VAAPFDWRIFPVALSLFSVIFSFFYFSIFLQIYYSFMFTYKKGFRNLRLQQKPCRSRMFCWALGALALRNSFAFVAFVVIPFVIIRFDKIHQQQQITSLQQSPLTQGAQRIPTISEWLTLCSAKIHLLRRCFCVVGVAYSCLLYIIVYRARTSREPRRQSIAPWNLLVNYIYVQDLITTGED
jgi:hypothetical protein